MCNTVEGWWWSGTVAATDTAAWSDVPEPAKTSGLFFSLHAHTQLFIAVTISVIPVVKTIRITDM